MTKQKKILIALSIILIVGIIFWFLYKYNKLPKVLGITQDNKYNSAGGLLVDYGDVIDMNKIIVKGDKSNTVARVQMIINDLIDKYNYAYTKLSVDGIFGDKTQAAIKFVSGNTLDSGTATGNKIYNLPKIATGALLPPPNVPTITTATPTYSAGRTVEQVEPVIIQNPYLRYMA